MLQRQLKNLNKERQSELNSMFPEIIEQVYGYEDDIPGYFWVAISIFDRWLPKEEHHLIDEVPEETHLSRLHVLHSFMRSLIERTEVITFRCRGRQKNTAVFKEFTTKEMAVMYCERSTNLTPRSDLYVVVLPYNECVIRESRDYTNHVYFRNRELIKPILDMAKKHRLNESE